MEIFRFFAGEYPFYITATLLIFLGIALFIIKKNLLVAVLALEVAFNGINLLFVTASHYLGDPKGKMVVLIALAISAGSFAIGLILTVNYYRLKRSLSIDELTLLGERKDE
ncbi:MAG: NADH-quinone oxidoreductase subunit NuoK [Caldimicrobium sp.]